MHVILVVQTQKNGIVKFYHHIPWRVQFQAPQPLLPDLKKIIYIYFVQTDTRWKMQLIRVVAGKMYY
jgi:hypothetical protein